MLLSPFWEAPREIRVRWVAVTMRVAKEATLLARKRHAAGVKRLHEIFAYDPLKPPRPPQHGGKVKRERAVN